jgi:hypothetical protein
MAASSNPPTTDLKGAAPASRFRWLNTRFKQVTAAILGLGALIGAVQAIIGVIPSGPEAQGVKVGTLQVGVLTLEEFQIASLDQFAAVDLRLAAQTVTPTPTPTVEETPTPTPTPDDCDPTVEECPPDDGEEEDGDTPDIPDEQQIEEQYSMGPGCDSDPAASECALAELADSAATSGTPEPQSSVPRRRTISRVRKVLEGTRTRRDDDGQLQPLGMMVTFDVTLTGLEDENVTVFWSMLSADTRRPLPSNWLRNTRAVVLRPRRPTDQIGKDIWLPLPRRRGDYVARLTFRDPDDETLTSVRTKVFH